MTDKTKIDKNDAKPETDASKAAALPDKEYKKIRANVLTALAEAKKSSQSKAPVADDDQNQLVPNRDDSSPEKGVAAELTDNFKKSKNKLTPAPKAEEPAVATVKKASKSTKFNSIKIIKASIWSFLVVLILFMVVLGTGVYYLGWDSPGIKKLSRYLPLPAGLIGNQPVWLVEYWSDIDTLTYFYNYQVEQGNFKAVPPNSEINNIVWDRLVNIRMVENLAKEYGVVVTPDDVKFEVDKIVNEAGNRELLSNNLYDYYRWDINTFSNKVISPYLLEQKVTDTILADEKYEQEIKDQALSIRQQVIDNPNSFADLAKEYSADTVSAQRGGDLGYFNKGVMIPEFEKAAFSLAVGEISEPVRTKFGYHIILVTDKQVNKDDPEDIQVKASHILIAPLTIQDILERAKDKTKIRRFIDRNL